MKWIVAANRDRDHYQVPIALAERNRLAQLVTDYYEGATRPRIPALRHRRDPALPASLVTTAYGTLAVEIAQRVAVRSGFKMAHPTRTGDYFISRTTERVLHRFPQSDLFLYSGYAAPVFKRERDRFRALF